MPKVATELTPIAIRNLKPKIGKDGKPIKSDWAVGGVPGLYIQVTPTGAKSWILRKVFSGKRQHYGLGSYPAVSLKMARELARDYVQQLSMGQDPFAERRKLIQLSKKKQQPSMTFKQAAKEFIEIKDAESSKRTHDQWAASLESYAYPIIGNVDVADINLEHVLEVLKPIWEAVPETASRVQSRMENIFAWCVVNGYRHEKSQNPAQWKGFLSTSLPSKAKVKEKAREKSGRSGFPSLHYSQISQFIKSLSLYRIQNPTAVDALTFLILTLPRSSELVGDKRTNKAGMTWQEVDLKERIWTIPGNRMKAGKDHVVVLSDRATDILKQQLKGMPEGMPKDLVFPGPKGDVPSDPFLRSIIKGINKNRKSAGKSEYVDSTSKLRITTHGFRSSFKQWAVEKTDFEDDISEIALSHQDKDQVRAAYTRNYQALEKRRKLMEAWSSWCFQSED